MNLIKNLLTGLLIIISSVSGLANSAPAVLPDTGTAQAPQTKNSSESFASSRNWSGYVASGGTFTGVSGTWIIPQVNNNGNFGADAAWVGIGGVTDYDLIQAGTQTTVGPDGKATYEAFYETLPEASKPLQIAVSSGNSVTVSVNQQSQGVWKIFFRNNTSGESTSLMQSYDSSLSSADWIEEAPSGIRRVMPLNNFGTIKFSNAAAVRNGQSVNLAQSNAQAINMCNISGQTLAMASGVTNDGAGFSVSRSSTADIRSGPADSISSGGVSVPGGYIRVGFRRHRDDD